jgi:hypothetical protein
VFDITLDASGSVLYLSQPYHAVFRITNTPATTFPPPQLIAGSNSPTGHGSADGPALAATFYNPRGITSDTTNNIAYISDYYNHRIRTLHLTDSNSSDTVATLAGSTQGSTDAAGTIARFNYPYGIVYHNSSGSSGGVLYVAEYIGARVRRILVATATVTTVAALPTNGIYLCITNNGTSLYVTTSYAVVRVNAADGALLTVAGDASAPGFADGVGSSARFNGSYGIALNTDESALVIVDQCNQRIRKLLLANNNVTTVAGSGAPGHLDGQALTATFSSAYGAKRHCNATEGTCGVRQQRRPLRRPRDRHNANRGRDRWHSDRVGDGAVGVGLCVALGVHVHVGDFALLPCHLVRHGQRCFTYHDINAARYRLVPHVF